MHLATSGSASYIHTSHSLASLLPRSTHLGGCCRPSTREDGGAVQGIEVTGWSSTGTNTLNNNTGLLPAKPLMEVDGAVQDAAGPGPGSAFSRAKGRVPGEIRTLLCERSVLERADGSAKWGQEGSSVLAAVHGPRQAGARKEDSEKAVVEVVFKQRTGLAGPVERQYESILRQTIEGLVMAALHPRTSITVILQVLQDDGSILACAVNAAVSALVDAGIPMSTMLAAVSCAFTQDGQLLLDPDAAEEKAARSVLSFACPHHHALDNAGAQQELVLDEGLLMSHTRGICTVEQYIEAAEAARSGCRGLAKFSQLALVSGFKERLA